MLSVGSSSWLMISLVVCPTEHQMFRFTRAVYGLPVLQAILCPLSTNWGEVDDVLLFAASSSHLEPFAWQFVYSFPFEPSPGSGVHSVGHLSLQASPEIERCMIFRWNKTRHCYLHLLPEELCISVFLFHCVNSALKFWLCQGFAQRYALMWLLCNNFQSGFYNFVD